MRSATAVEVLLAIVILSVDLNPLAGRDMLPGGGVCRVIIVLLD